MLEGASHNVSTVTDKAYELEKQLKVKNATKCTNAHVIRGEKSLRHFVMVAKFLDDNKPNFCAVFTYSSVLYEVGA